MATEAQLIQGLKAADAAGNSADAQHFADAIKAMRAQVPASAGPQPSFMQDVAASPIGRFAHDAIVQPAEGLASLALKAVPGLNMMAPAFDKSIQQGPETFYKNSLSAQHNVPGYAEARAKADAVQARLDGVPANSLGQQFTAPFNSGVAGLGGLITGGWNGANAAADAQSSAQNTFSAAHPIASTAAQMIGGLSAVPERQPLPLLLKQSAPSISDLKNAASAAYDQVDNSGHIVSANSFDKMASGLKGKLASEGIDQTLHPNALAAANRVTSAAGQNITFKGLENLRRVAGDAIGASTMNPSDKRMAYIVQNHIDDFVNGLSPTDLVGGAQAGDPAQTVQALNDARGYWNRASQASLIQKQIDKATLSATTYSQSGMENAIRAQFRNLAKNEKAMSRLSPNVQDAVKAVVQGSPVSNVLRAVGKYAPHGPVATAAGMLTGSALAGPGGAVGGVALPLAGEAARQGATAMTKAAAQRALEAALLGKTAIPQVSAPLLGATRIPQTLPYGLIGSTAPQFAQGR